MDLTPYLIDGRLPCARAFLAAQTLEATAAEVAAHANRTDVRVCHCQLGLFGYDAFGGKGFPGTIESVPETVADALRNAASGDEISCAAAWHVADRLGIPRPLAGACADRLNLRITRCQLGCFP